MAIDKDRLKRYLRELSGYLDAVRIQTARRALQGKLIDLLASGSIDPGRPGELEAAVRELLGPEYAQVVRGVEARYQDLVELQNLLYDDLGVDVRRNALRVRAIEETVRLEIGAYGDDAAREVSRRVRRAILEGDNTERLKRRLEGISDRVDANRDTLAKSQLMRYSRTLKVQQAAIAQVQYFEYAGIVQPTTRPFCRAHVGRTLHHDNVLRMRNGNREPVETNCGGWNCQHLLEPDPFAKGQSPGLRFVENGEGNARVRGYTDEAGAAILLSA